jgi:hypothetical protein
MIGEGGDIRGCKHQSLYCVLLFVQDAGSGKHRQGRLGLQFVSRCSECGHAWQRAEADDGTVASSSRLASLPVGIGGVGGKGGTKQIV